MSSQVKKVKQRPIYPVIYLGNKDAQRKFLVRRPTVGKMIIADSHIIGSSKYNSFYKSQKRVSKIMIFSLVNSKKLSQLRKILYYANIFTIFGLNFIDKLFFTFFRNLENLKILGNKAPRHSILKRQAIPSLKMLTSPDGHFSRMYLAKRAEKICLLDTFIVNVEPFAFMRNLKDLSLNFDENLERNEVNYKNYLKLIKSVKLRRLKIEESIYGKSKLRYLDFLKEKQEQGFDLGVSIRIKRLSLNNKLYYTSSNVFDKMNIEGVNSFTFIGIPKISSNNLMANPELSDDKQNYLDYFDGMINHFPRFKTDASFSMLQSPDVLERIYKILNLENCGVNVLTLNLTLCEEVYKIILAFAPLVDKMTQLDLNLEIPKNITPTLFKEYEDKLSKIPAPKNLPDLHLRVQLDNIASLDNLLFFIESSQHLFKKKSFHLRLIQSASAVVFSILVTKLKSIKNLDFGPQFVLFVSHLGLMDAEDFNVGQPLMDLSRIVLNKTLQFTYNDVVLSTHIAKYEATLKRVEEIIATKYFTKIVSFRVVTQTGKPLFNPI